MVAIGRGWYHAANHAMIAVRCSCLRPLTTPPGSPDTQLTLRTCDLTAARAGPAARVVVFGGSMTWGEGAQDCPLTHGEPVPSHHSAEAMQRCAWPAFLQRFFDLAYGRGVVSVQNAAVRGTDSSVVVGEDGWIPGSRRWLTVEGHGPPTVVMCVCCPPSARPPKQS